MSVAGGSPRFNFLGAYREGDLSHDVIYLPHSSPFNRQIFMKILPCRKYRIEIFVILCYLHFEAIRCVNDICRFHTRFPEILSHPPFKEAIDINASFYLLATSLKSHCWDMLID